MKRCLFAIAEILSTACFSIPTYAAMPGTMHDQGLLPGTRNKVAILEFTNPTGTWGLELSQILTREMLGSLRGVSSFGVLNLRQDERYVELNPTTATEIAQKQNALAVVWGEFFEAGTKVYLHSHLRIVSDRKIPPEASRLKIRDFPPRIETVPDRSNAKPSPTPLALAFQTKRGVVKAAPPSLLINFAPIELDTYSLQAIKESHRQTSTIRLQPDADSVQVGTLETRDAFGVENVRGPWMQIQTSRSISGWVNYASLEGRTNLSGLYGLLTFTQGVLQYLSGNFGAAQETISGYLNRPGEEQDKSNLALAHILLGNALFQRNSADSIRAAANEYLKASELLPNAAAPANYLAVARLKEFQNAAGDVPEMHDLEARLIRAVQAQNDADTLENLRVLYRCAAVSKFLREPEMNSASYSEQIARQIRLVDQVADELKDSR